MTKATRSTLTLVITLAFLAVAGEAQADESYGIEIRIISAQPDGAGVDPALSRLSADLANLPFKSYKQLDFHARKVRKGETVTMQFPGPGNRFLDVRANGTRDGKHLFRLGIDALNFKTFVRIPDNGTLIVGGPQHERGVILLAITARAARVAPQR